MLPVLAHAAAPDEDAGKLELSAGLTRSTNSLFRGILLQSRSEPLIAANYERGRFFANSQTGVGYKLVRTDSLSLGVSANYMLGRRESSEARYRGLGNVDGTLAAYAYFEWQPVKDLLTVYGNLAQSLRRANGLLGNLGATLAVPLRPGVSAFLDYGQGFADGRNLQAYYGVAPNQSAASGYPVYTASSGRYSSSLSLGVQADLNERWTMLLSVGRTRLEGAAAASPIVQTRQQPQANLFVTYRFDGE